MARFSSPVFRVWSFGRGFALGGQVFLSRVEPFRVEVFSWTTRFSSPFVPDWSTLPGNIDVGGFSKGFPSHAIRYSLSADLTFGHCSCGFCDIAVAASF